MFDNQDPVQDEVDNLISDGVLSASEVVGGVFFARDQLLRMRELTISSSTNLIDKGRLQIHEDAARNMLARAGRIEEGVESIVSSSNGFVAWRLHLRLDIDVRTASSPEEGVVCVASSSNGFVAWVKPVRLSTVLEA